MDYKFWSNLRKKVNKTEEEKLLLDLRKSVTIASEILISYDKCHYTEEETIERIRNTLKEVINEL